MHTIETPMPATASRYATLDWKPAARTACARIAPLWPLQDFVAVNPFLGLTDRPFSEVCDHMQRLVPGGMQMPASYYREKLESGALNDADLSCALAEAAKILPSAQAECARAWTPEHLRAALEAPFTNDADSILLTIAETVDQREGTQWANIIVESISRFCAAYFDAGQSAWRMPWRELQLYQAWRKQASLDASLEVLGLPGFRDWAKSLPEDADETLDRLLPDFRIAGEALENFFHKQLLSIRGWAGFVQYRARENNLYGRGEDESLRQLLAIRLAFDAAVLRKFDGPEFREFWPEEPGEAGASGALPLFIFQLADEQVWQRQLTAKLRAGASAAEPVERPAAQAVFCIDVRSEVFRRAFESASPRLQTLGFAGFFGLPIEATSFGQRQAVAQCPVLLTPKYSVHETLSGATADDEQRAMRQKRLGQRIAHSWNSFKTSAISCFSFVETAGLVFGPKLLRSTFAPAAPAMPHDAACAPSLEPDQNGHGGIPPADRIALARGALRNMGLTRNFARLVLFCGHGSATTNNPYAAGLDCGACGGHAGDTNARVGAAILNDSAVRASLAGEGLHIPGDTWFLGGLHNTTTDDVTLFDLDRVPDSHRDDLADLQSWLATAGGRARSERAALLGLANTERKLDEKVSARSRDWSQVRPEWGLAGNAAFVAAPRARTRSANLGGRVFLHNYDHHADEDSSTLELIMCAPMVVANWINLQYFASTANNAVFGSGNKVIHNVVGTLGVCLGNSGDLQTGLPLQSVHDGKRWVHEPLRLHVLIEAPRDRIEAVLAKHEGVRQLIDHGWLLLFAIEQEGATLLRYLPGGRWEPLP